MKFAILIIAHKNIEQTMRLANCFDDRFDVYIHFDAKMEIKQETKPNRSNIYILQKRLSGFLDDWSLVEIAMNLYMSAKKNRYAYYCLLSGQDYPVKTMDYISEFFERNYPKPFIDCTPAVKGNWVYSTFKRIRKIRDYNSIKSKCQNQYWTKVRIYLLYAKQMLETIIKGSPSKNLTKIGWEMYGGSAWWVLPDIVMEEIEDIYKEKTNNNERICQQFKVKIVPEETFFQTCIMNSKFKDQVVVNQPFEEKQNCLTYAYFCDEEHAATGHPYVFTMKNKELLDKLPHLFARKFDYSVDEKILDYLDRRKFND